MVNRIFVVPTVPGAPACVRVYTIEKHFSKRELRAIGAMLTNPVSETYIINEYAPRTPFPGSVEIGFLPGVTDNVANTAREMIEDGLGVLFTQGEGVYTSCITTKRFINPLIHRMVINKTLPVPRVQLTKKPKVDKVMLDVSDDELQAIGKNGIKNADGTHRGPLALDLPAMKAIQTHFRTLGRNPTDVELESLAQTWSEHCKHTIMNSPIDDISEGLFRRYIKRATDNILKTKKHFCVSVFSDNSGAIAFDRDWVITHKVETHNSPSALDPFGGAVTGIVGVNRDCIGFGLGAKPIANTYGFCVAEPNDHEPLFRDQEHTRPMLSPRRILDGVIAGVNSGGNCSGIPTPQGFVYFDRRYKGKPLVFVGTVGLLPTKKNGRLLYKKRARPGDYIVMVGGKVGLDGIHGATFSSEALSIGSPATAVQIGDPITQKKVCDALVKEARNLNLYNSITDNGAGGLSCSVAEMAKESGGCYVNLDKVPLKYPGLAPWQIWISESQERMTLAIPKKKWKKFTNLMKRRGVEATVIGVFNASGECVVAYKNKKVMDVGMDFLHGGLPVRPMQTAFVKKTNAEPKLSGIPDMTKLFLTILGRLNVTSFECISMQYDHEVQGTSVLKPLHGRGRVNADATVIRPLPTSGKGLVISQGLYPAYSDIDTYQMAACSIDTAVRNAVAAGADPDRIALLDNFCWCSSHEPERLGQFKRAAKGCYDCATAYGAPFISGKDSMFNDFEGYDEKGNFLKISIPPTLLISSLGVIDDVTNVISLDAKCAGDLVYLLGETHDELGGSEYFSLLGSTGNAVPVVRPEKNKRLYQALHACIARGLIASAQSVGRGGLAVALARTALGGMLGFDVSLNNLPGRVSRDDFVLFSESQGRILVTIAPHNQQWLKRLMKGNALTFLGTITEKSQIHIEGMKENTVVDVSLEEALRAYRGTFKDY